MSDYAKDYWEKGYALIKGVFTRDEVARIQAASDRVKQFGKDQGGNYRHGNLVFWVEEDPSIGINVRGVQWPAHLEKDLEWVRTHPKMKAIVEPLIGDTVRQIINQIHWKTPGGKTSVRWHADRLNRLPKTCYRDLANSYIQTGLAIDPQIIENGCLQIIPNSHLKVREADKKYTNFSRGGITDSLTHYGYTPDDAVPLIMEPGDLALWHVDTLHGSELNTHPTLDRALYINGYVKAKNCSRGNWAWIEGQPIPVPPVDVAVYIQRDDAFEATEAVVTSEPQKFTD